MHELPRKVLLQIPPIFGIDMSITNEVILLWMAGLVTLIIVMAGCRRKHMVASGFWQNLFDSIAEFMGQGVIRDILGPQAQRWTPFLMTLFFFILSMNLFGLLPLPHHAKAMTSSMSVTLGLAMLVFIITLVVNIRAHGFIGFLGKFLPEGVPPALRILVMPIEVISWLARPLSLAIRLFANMLAGHALVLIFISMCSSLAWFLKPLPLVGAVVMSAFELFVAFIQAFIFTLLAGMYIKDALDKH
jgi:F-type H+-transporting ATPase subunit a